MTCPRCGCDVVHEGWDHATTDGGDTCWSLNVCGNPHECGHEWWEIYASPFLAKYAQDTGPTKPTGGEAA